MVARTVHILISILNIYWLFLQMKFSMSTIINDKSSLLWSSTVIFQNRKTWNKWISSNQEGRCGSSNRCWRSVTYLQAAKSFPERRVEELPSKSESEGTEQNRTEPNALREHSDSRNPRSRPLLTGRGAADGIHLSDKWVSGYSLQTSLVVLYAPLCTPRPTKAPGDPCSSQTPAACALAAPQRASYGSF